MSRFVMPLQSAFGQRAVPFDGAQLFFFDTGTSNAKNTFSDEALTTPNANPVIADANGLFPAIWLGGGQYKVQMKDKNGVAAGFGEEDPVERSLTAANSIINKGTIAEMVADISLALDDVVSLDDYATGNNAGWMIGAVVAAATGTDDGGSFIDLPNTTPALQWKQNFSRNGISINQFGAKTGTDSTTAINNTLAKGGRLTGEPGTYLCTTLTTVSNTHLFGPRSLILKLKDTSDVDLMDVAATTNVTLEGFTLDGNKANQTVDFNAVCLRGDGCEDLTVFNVLNINSTLTGINIRNDKRTHILGGFIKDSGTENSVNSGDAIFLQNSTDPIVDGTDIDNPARIGVVLKGTVIADSKINTGAKVSLVTVRNSGENAFSAEDGVEDFTFTTCKAFTTGTSAFASTKSGFAVGEQSVDGTLTDCEAHDTPQQGFELTNGPTNITLNSPKSFRAGTSGIQASASNAIGGTTNLTINDPFVEDATLDGIAITAAVTNPVLAANINRQIFINGGCIKTAGRDAFVGASMDGWSVDGLEVDTTGTGAGIRWIDSCNGKVKAPGVVKAASRGLYSQGNLIQNINNHVNGGNLFSCGTWGYFQINTDDSTAKNMVVRNRAEDFGTHTGGNNVAILTDSTQNWVTNVLVNAVISNTTDGSTATITANTATTVTGTLSGGTDDDWDTSDAYTIGAFTTVGVRAEGTGGSNIFANNDATTITTPTSSTNATDVFFDNDQQATRTFGTGSPEGVVTAIVGSKYFDDAGGSGTTFWGKVTGTGNTGWELT